MLYQPSVRSSQPEAVCFLVFKMDFFGLLYFYFPLFLLSYKHLLVRDRLLSSLRTNFFFLFYFLPFFSQQLKHSHRRNKEAERLVFAAALLLYSVIYYRRLCVLSKSGLLLLVLLIRIHEAFSGRAELKRDISAAQWLFFLLTSS